MTSDEEIKLWSLLSKLQVEVSELKEENAFLKLENEELRGRLKMDSNNSSKPPSSDGLRKKPAFPRKKGGKVGGKFKHKGKTLKMSDTPDEIVDIRPVICECGCSLEGLNTVLESTGQVFEIPEPRLEITEYRTYSCTCPHCRKKTKSKFPSGIGSGTQYGSMVKGFTSYLRNQCMLSFEKTSQLFADLFGQQINESTIFSNDKRCYNLLEPVENAIKAILLKSPLTYSDETGLRCNGGLYWLHVFSSETYTYLFAHKNRGREALESEKSLFPFYTGTSVHDCWASYFNIPGIDHVLCGAHILRELQFQIDQGRKWAVGFHKFYMSLYLKKESGELSLKEETIEQCKELIKAGLREEPPPVTGARGKPRQTKGHNLLDRIEKHIEAFLAFAFDEDIPFTNNLAERDLRPAKIKQKIAGCFRTETGAEYYARISGFISTMRKQGKNVFTQLRNLFDEKEVVFSCS